MIKNINQCRESIATGIVKPKTTALFFDKLWIPDGYENYDANCNIPKEIRFKINRPLSMDIENRIRHETSSFFFKSPTIYRKGYV